MKRNWQQDTAAFRSSAAGAGHLVRQAADMSAWAVVWAALRGRPPLLSDEAARKIRVIQHSCGAGTALLGLYTGVMTVMEMSAVIPGAAILAFSLLLSAIFAGLMLRGPRVPESHRLEYQPAHQMPPIKPMED